MCELTQLSIRQYRRANGEVIALLVIAPSKTDRERVIPMSAELFHIIAMIIRRQTSGGQPTPLVRRFDPHDKGWSAPLPFLVQRLGGSTRAVIGTGTVLLRIRRICATIAESNPAFRGLRLTPHDFRRIFATELVNSGLPIHIGAALLGHLNVQTTRGYVAVFDEDVVRHYQAPSSSVGKSGLKTSTPPSLRRSGPSSRSTSTNARSNSVPAHALTARPVSTTRLLNRNDLGRMNIKVRVPDRH
jgi:integrase